MAINRRWVLAALAGGLTGQLLPQPLRAVPAGPVYLSARVGKDGTFTISGFGLSGEAVFDLELPGRGHSFAVSPDGHVAVHFARRPGNFAVVIDVSRGVVLGSFAPSEDRRFQGHGVFDPAGRLLYTSENDFEAARGVIGIYDASNRYARVGEIPSHGVGPHEIILLRDGTTLAVANGGIATHPDFPRVKLNLAEMRSFLSYVDRRDGTLLGEYRLAPSLHRLSIRHLAANQEGTVALAMQYEGPRRDLVPLVALHQGGQLCPLRATDAVLQAMKQYCGSVAFDWSGQVIAASAPRGNLITFWDGEGWLSLVQVEDGSGIAPTTRTGEFVATSGGGGGFRVDVSSGTAQPIDSDFLLTGHWDNHLVACRPDSPKPT